MSRMTPPTSPRLETRSVLAHYILFRHVQKARQRGWLSPESEASSAKFLREGVSRSWDKLFPMDRADSQAWARDRLEFLRDQRMIPEQSVPLLRDRLQKVAIGAGVSQQQGALLFMWRLHSLYIELAEAVDAGQIPPEYLPRITELLHEKALDSANRILRRHQTLDHQNPFLEDVLTMARSLVGTMKAAGSIGDDEEKYLMGALAPLPQLTPGPQKGGIGSCQVCGFDIVGASACYCSQCETPHHRDCWSYNEGCAMFACRGKKLLDGTPASIH